MDARMTRTINLDQGWSFRRLGSAGSPETNWLEVALPHSPFVSDLDGNHHWMGECEYRRVLTRSSLAGGTRCVLFIGAAMHPARVFVDQREIARHEGGYLPFEVDLTEVVSEAATREITLRLDNRDNPDVPPENPSTTSISAGTAGSTAEPNFASVRPCTSPIRSPRTCPRAAASSSARSRPRKLGRP
jgi:beta-galactosidase/beta-glucuronidase